MITILKNTVLLILFSSCASFLYASEEIEGRFKFNGERIQIFLSNTGKRDLIVAGFIEGLQSAKISTKENTLPVVKNEKLTDFDLTNRNIMWLRLRAGDVEYQGLGNSFHFNEVIKNNGLLEYIKKNKVEDLLIEVNCRTASFDGTTVGKFTPIKVILYPK